MKSDQCATFLVISVLKTISQNLEETPNPFYSPPKWCWLWYC